MAEAAGIPTERLRRAADILTRGAKHARDKAARRRRLDDEQTDIEVATIHVEAAACIRAVIAARELVADQQQYASGARDGDRACQARVEVAERLTDIVGGAGAAEGGR